MPGRLFNWTDIARISRSVATDVPRTKKEIQDWSAALLSLASGVYHVLRSVQGTLETDRNLANGVTDMLMHTAEQLFIGLELLPKYQFLLFWEEIIHLLPYPIPLEVSK